jgi:cytochrome c-type biogenesis protein CcmH
MLESARSVPALVLACALLSLPGQAPAQASAPASTPTATRQAQPMSADPVLEARVLKVAEELRCLVCQNETIAASHADLAVDLRKQIRVKLSQGQSERQILDFMVERYGDFVLYRPRLTATTVLLWAGPFLLLLTAAGVLAFNIRKRRQGLVAEALSPAQAQRARELLEESAQTPRPSP